jgi:predicted GIY-YIG superfamily endonuclease
MPFTYLLRCADDTLYVGHTEDLALREQTHNDVKGARFTAARRPGRMVYAEEHASVVSAIARERQLKRWSHEKKHALITADHAALRSLSRQTMKSMAVFTGREPGVRPNSFRMAGGSTTLRTR